MAAFQSETVDVTDQVTKGPTHVSLVLEAGHRPVDADAASIQNAVAFFRKRGAVCLELVIRNETPLDDLPRSFPEAFESPTIVVFCDHLATYSSGPFRVSFRFFRQPLPTPNTFRSMVSLTIAEQFWPPPLPAEGPDALRLLRLCIQLRTCWSKPLGMSNPLARHGVFVERLESPWNCPVLEEVEFTFPQRRNCPFARSNSFECICTVSACTMCLRDVREFITSNLRFPTPRLGRVILSGVHAVVDPDPASELIALQAIVDELHVSAAESESSATIGREWEARNSHRWVPTQVFSNAVKFSFDLDDSLGTVPDYFDFYHRA
ncbi:hypothetical protein EXIGLDRAFT_767223 [Exidia glandulosa HHB12029]|uniref:Uncharacterized protein n=1 Tax=Exidia glandulosa HHB12029 TaxID=1314781 RepID=A0A165J5T3_EXIGL|nr:hypothetical protein EXIGLDRAFT_767223 [Exidia glandulosa HHB12029]